MCLSLLQRARIPMHNSKFFFFPFPCYTNYTISLSLSLSPSIYLSIYTYIYIYINISHYRMDCIYWFVWLGFYNSQSTLAGCPYGMFSIQ